MITVKSYHSNGSIQSIITVNDNYEKHSFNDKPAECWYDPNGDEYSLTWYKDGLTHRDNDLPAIIGYDTNYSLGSPSSPPYKFISYIKYIKDGQRYNRPDNQPNQISWVWNSTKNKLMLSQTRYYIYYNGVDEKRHNLYGPAIIDYDHDSGYPFSRQYFVNGKKVSDDEHNNYYDTIKSWCDKKGIYVTDDINKMPEEVAMEFKLRFL